MGKYTIEGCSMYKDSVVIAGVPIYIFDDHSMALPAWGVCCSRLGQKLNLITFDSHTDTHPSFNSYIFDQTGEAADLWHRGTKNPEIAKLLEEVNYQFDNFCFEDVYKITVGYLKNSEQILAGVDLSFTSWPISLFISAIIIIISYLISKYRHFDNMSEFWEIILLSGEAVLISAVVFFFGLNSFYHTVLIVLFTETTLTLLNVLLIYGIKKLCGENAEEYLYRVKGVDSL